MLQVIYLLQSKEDTAYIFNYTVLLVNDYTKTLLKIWDCKADGTPLKRSCITTPQYVLKTELCNFWIYGSPKISFYNILWCEFVRKRIHSKILQKQFALTALFLCFLPNCWMTVRSRSIKLEQGKHLWLIYHFDN